MKRPNDFGSHRGIGLFVKGDNSGSVLVIQYAAGNMRDYIIPINFNGNRYIEIPNGEVSYASESTWGWRYNASKKHDYSNVGLINLGFGYVPGKTRTRCKG